MIAVAIARKNLACLTSKPSSVLCKSHVSLFLSIHNFTTSTEKHVYDVLVQSHRFSPESASLAASDLTRRCSPERGDSLLSWLKENGFSSTQLEKLVIYKPRILGVNVEEIKFKFKIFKDLGFSTQETAELLSKNPVILHVSARAKIIPSLSVLKGLLGSDEDVAIDLKCCGISLEHIHYFIHRFPRCLLMKPHLFRKSIDKVREMGVTQSRKMFILAVGVIASTRESTWKSKFRALQDLGFSDSDILEMFKKAPYVFCASTVKIKKVTELLLATGKFDMSSIIDNPTVFGCKF